MISVKLCEIVQQQMARQADGQTDDDQCQTL